MGPWRGGSDGAAAGPCPACGGALVPGRVGFPLVGTPKFSYRVRATEVSTDIAATMCESCGLVTFRAANPGPVLQARAAMRGAAHRRPLRPERLVPGRVAHTHSVRDVYAELLRFAHRRPRRSEPTGLPSAAQSQNRRDQ